MKLEGEKPMSKSKKIEKKKISPTEIQNLHTNIRNNDNFPMEETKTRSTLIVGKSHSGKTTGVGTLKDICYSPQLMSLFSDTFEPKYTSFSLQDKDNEIKYTLNIIDTPGLKEVKKIGEDARSDDVILSTINYCLKNEITKINCLLIFISFETGVGSDDLDSFSTFIEKFGHEKLKIGIIITRAENKTDEWKKEMMDQLNQHTYFSNILKKENVKVMFLGCVDSMQIQAFSNIDDLEYLYSVVNEMRTELLKFIFSAEGSVKLIDLPIAFGIKNSVQECFKIQFDILTKLENCTDFSIGNIQTKIDEFSLNIDAIASCQAILFDDEMNKMFLEMKGRMKNICPKMDEKTRARFSGKVILK